MTALAQYARLESTGLWRPSAGEPARVVGLTFGDATLVILDDEGSPLSHWSLPAVRRLNPGEAPARYGPDGGAEELEVEDDILSAALERVRHSLRPRGRARLRRALVAGVAAFLAGTLALWAPGALREEALAGLPAARRSEIGATLLGHLQRGWGPACRDPLALAALEALRARVAGGPGQAVVLFEGPPHPLRLPGDIVVLGRAAVETASEPAVLAGHILAAGRGDALRPLLEEAGVLATLRVLATGGPGDAALGAHARRLLDAPPAPPSPDALASSFARAQVPVGPYRAAVEPGAVPEVTPGPPAPPLIADADWVSLQGICRGA